MTTWTLDETKPHVSIRCPCGGTATAGSSTEDGTGFVVHSLPECDAFIRLDPSDYLAWARKKRRARLGMGKSEPFHFVTFTCACGWAQTLAVPRVNKSARCIDCGARHTITPQEVQSQKPKR